MTVKQTFYELTYKVLVVTYNHAHLYHWEELKIIEWQCQTHFFLTMSTLTLNGTDKRPPILLNHLFKCHKLYIRRNSVKRDFKRSIIGPKSPDKIFPVWLSSVYCLGSRLLTRRTKRLIELFSARHNVENTLRHTIQQTQSVTWKQRTITPEASRNVISKINWSY